MDFAQSQELALLDNDRSVRNLQPYAGIFQASPAGWEPDPGEQSIPLSHYLWVLRRHRWTILAFIGISVIGTLIVSKRLTPIYESAVTVDVDRQAPAGIIGAESTQAALNDADQFLATQVRLIQSDSVLRPVAEQYHLRALDQGRAAESPVILRDLKVSRPPNTYLLLISYRSKDPALAAKVSNSVAQSYVEHTYNIRFRAAASLSSFMERQLEELKAKMESSNAALAAFEKELNMINPEAKTDILSARLLQLNTSYTSAQSERLNKEAAYKSVSGGSLESAEVSTQGEALKTLTERLNDAQQKFAETKAHYGPSHPEYKKSETMVDQVQQQLAATRSSVVRRVEIEYAQAVNRETMLSAAVAATKAEFDKLNARSFEYQTRKHEADADKKLYEELITKIREAGINAGFQSSTVRIADNARPGLKPVFPDIPLNLALALVLSTLAAIGGAILSDTLDTTIRDTEQVSRIAKAEVIGGLPQVKRWKSRLTPGEADSGIVRRDGDDRMFLSFEEAIGTLRNTILLGSFDRRIKSLQVTSAVPGEGKSTVALYLAMAHAQQRHKTLLIDCDLRRPSIDRKLGLKEGKGLTQVVLNELPWREAVWPSSECEHFFVLSTGTASRRAADLIGKALPQILDEAAAEFDLIVIDGPPTLGFPEPIQMATAVDGVLVIALAGQTDRKALASVISTLKRVRANVVGVALNEITKDVGDSYYYHGYYGKYSRYYHLKRETV